MIDTIADVIITLIFVVIMFVVAVDLIKWGWMNENHEELVILRFVRFMTGLFGFILLLTDIQIFIRLSS